jgi:hypothetical protein
VESSVVSVEEKTTHKLQRQKFFYSLRYDGKLLGRVEEMVLEPDHVQWKQWRTYMGARGGPGPQPPEFFSKKKKKNLK